MNNVKNILLTCVTLACDDSLVASCSWSDAGSTSHQGEDVSPSEAVWNDEDREGGVQVHSEAVTKSSSDLLLSSWPHFPSPLFNDEYHSLKCYHSINRWY